MLRYFKTLEGVGERMLPVLARVPRHARGAFAPFFADEAHINLRFLHYPPQETDDDEQFGQGPHTDNSFITILAREDVPGLAVRLPSGEWLAPPVIPGTFLVNLGNMMKRWSNDRFLSTPHGVLNESGTDRYSIAFFYSPNIATTHRVPAELHRARTIRRATRRRSTATSSSSSTTRITSTGPDTARPRRPDAPRGRGSAPTSRSELRGGGSSVRPSPRRPPLCRARAGAMQEREHHQRHAGEIDDVHRGHKGAGLPGLGVRVGASRVDSGRGCQQHAGQGDAEQRADPEDRLHHAGGEARYSRGTEPMIAV